VEPLALVVAIVVLAAIGVAVAWWMSQRRRSERLRDRFGPEYERTIEQADDRRAAEKELEARQQRVDSLEIRTLSGPDRARFGERWRVVQGLFVDDPSMAVEQADTLIGEVMRARGYPVGDFEQRAADVSVDHPQVVDHYRTAHRIAERRIAGGVDTEELRQAFVHYRALFADLLETGEARRTADPGASLARTADERARDRADVAGARSTRRSRATDASDDIEEPAEPARRP
jgi:hypothetical protein